MSTEFSVDPQALRSGWGVKWGDVEADVLPAWVADMDFPAPAAVRARLTEAIDRSDLGYPYWPDGDPLVATFEERMERRFGWRPLPAATRVFSDLIQILQVVIEATASHSRCRTIRRSSPRYAAQGAPSFRSKSPTMARGGHSTPKDWRIGCALRGRDC